MKKVFLGVGHGGADSGAVANGLKEKNLNLAIAAACADELSRHGVTVKMSRKKDEEDTLNQEVKECNNFAPDLAVDIHNNAGGGDGVECWYSIVGGTGKTLADNILAAVVTIGQNSRGAKTRKNAEGRDYYGFIRMTKAPAVIVECAFIDNKKDIAIIDTPAEQKKMGVAVAKGILKTLGIAYKPVTTSTSKTTDLVKEKIKSSSTKKTTAKSAKKTTKTASKKAEENISVTYHVWDSVKKTWLPTVTNNKDYAGIFGNPICCIFAKLNKGDIFYRVHTKGSLLTRGRWLSEVKNEEDYAGIKSKVIDGVMMRTNTGKKIHYAVHLKKTGKWLPYVTGYNTKDKENGYAGILGEEIDGLRIYIE